MAGTDLANPKFERRESTVLQVSCTDMYVQSTHTLAVAPGVWEVERWDGWMSKWH